MLETSGLTGCVHAIDLILERSPWALPNERQIVSLQFNDGSLEVTEGGGMLAKGETAINLYRLATLKAMLRMEMRSRLRMSGRVNALQATEQMAGKKFGRGNREEALLWVESEIERLQALAE